MRKWVIVFCMGMLSACARRAAPIVPIIPADAVPLNTVESDSLRLALYDQQFDGKEYSVVGALEALGEMPVTLDTPAVVLTINGKDTAGAIGNDPHVSIAPHQRREFVAHAPSKAGAEFHIRLVTGDEARQLLAAAAAATSGRDLTHALRDARAEDA